MCVCVECVCGMVCDASCDSVLGYFQVIVIVMRVYVID